MTAFTDKLNTTLYRLFFIFFVALVLSGCSGEESSEETVDTIDNTSKGLIAHKFNGSWTELPDFTTLSPVESRIVENVGTHQLGDSHYGLVLLGLFEAKASGAYVFRLHSDDGAKLFINGQLIATNNGENGEATVVSQSMELVQGTHELRVEYFQGNGSQSLSLNYQLNGAEALTVDDNLLSYFDRHQDPNFGAITNEDDDDSEIGGEDDTCDSSNTPNSNNSLQSRQQIVNNEFIESNNGRYRFYLQGDGNLVLRRLSDSAALWSSATHDQGGVRFRLQGDGNMVLRNANGNALWSSKTNGTDATYLMLHNHGNLALHTPANEIVWQTDTHDGSNQCDDDSDSGDGTAKSREQFSSPDAALYALNDDRQLGFPKIIDTGFNGNGHSVTWDGRVFVRKRSQGWFATAFRPENIVRSNDGTVDFKRGAFGRDLLMQANEDAPDMQMNWLAIVIDPSETRENPYPSDANGNYSFNGTHRTYKALVYHTSKRNGDNDQMGFQKATFIVRDANTQNAQIISAEFTTEFQRFRTVANLDFRCIEPSATIDGRLVICQGHPDNNGRIDNLVYSWNPTPGGVNGWSVPKSIANMYWDDSDTMVDGIPFNVRFPIAERPLLDATGNDFNRDELIKGAYPWVSRDGSELFYQASREGVSARRTGTTVVGRWTGWTFRHIDGPINPRRGKSRLFLSSPGAFTTMWTPFKDINDLNIPYSLRGPVYPIIGSNSNDYSEVGFNDYLDGNFVLYLGMNEQLNRAGNFLVTRTNDTSGNFNNGTLVGAQFPNEFNNRDELVGRYGQAIYFNGGDYIEVAKNKGWDELAEGVTIDFWVKKINGNGTIRLFRMQNGLEVSLTNGNTLRGVITDTENNRIEISGPSIPDDRWTHIALSFKPSTGKIKLYSDGVLRTEKLANNFGVLQTSGRVRIGPESSSGLLLLDEVKVSNIARQDYEIGYYANIDIHREANAALKNRIPSHLQSLSGKAAAIENFSQEAADLGETLFNDVILSKQRTTSCATCHKANLNFTDGLAIAQGNEPTDAGVRNTPTLVNRLFSTLQGWSGGATTLDKQASVPIEAEHEMNLPMDEAIARLSSESNYAERFQQVYGESPNQENITAALASFQAIQFSPRTQYDNFVAGDRSALSDSEYRGLLLFEGKARCSGCHAGTNFTDESFRATGLVDSTDIGRADTTSRDRDFKLFKVPTLRGIKTTAPYMHNGSLATLEDVVEAYNDGANEQLVVDTDIRPLELTEQEITDLVTFLNSL
ncbi:cytochrome c peroxidase [Pleionea sp. CnH1-48]|uniref:cytochrome c peroxidase n=1 Tax=Pleionea sp. CnH1-48 TaxID=2954494 RepID=UPI0020985CED|nr:cytochrome c peroxidase [Pleionea sp. CnH1-48]MCO7223440.1 PA14 domain-containing protein [Pleionea sp. CnH1-48]